jgi:hypothetical protein
MDLYNVMALIKIYKTQEVIFILRTVVAIVTKNIETVGALNE